MSLSIQGPVPQSFQSLDSNSTSFSQNNPGQNGAVAFGTGDSSTINFGSVNGTHSNPLNYSSGNKSAQGLKSGVDLEQSLADMLEMLRPLIQQLLMMLQGGQQHTSSDNTGGGEKSGAGKGNTPITFGNESQPNAQGASGGEGVPKANGSGEGQKVKSGNNISSADAGNSPQDMPQKLWENCVRAGEKHGIDPFVLAAQAKQESSWGQDMGNGNGFMQVEEATRRENADPFRQQAGHEYDHSSQSDQVEMAAIILSNLDGDTQNKLEKYNGGPNWQPGSTDSFQRVTDPQGYAQKVMATAEALRSSAV
ncbi:hypothetical protein ACFQDN_23110 [Pseudomonas asuensis]|uniref:Transglycosylase SLT domain-containing protein n=1 Tax=Pseudomonas asuensis TaxID=1825787 RepID=A0ABQ2H3P9_9PSED|nr:hypothetical protein [Pseudomonas asuensis]GGM32690.1 hypothetical protein GCM10009425_48960 [Pseudomonas asuensis]